MREHRQFPGNLTPTHKEVQTSYYDGEADSQFETQRPHGGPLLYSQFLEEKFKRRHFSFPSLSHKRIT